MCKQILLPTSVKSEMMKTFKTGHKALERALKFQINSGSARKLRAAALQRGGLIYNDIPYDKGFIPECDTHFDHASGTITQVFESGIRVVISKQGATAKVFNGDREIAEFHDMTLNKWSRVLFGLQMIYNNLNN